MEVVMAGEVPVEEQVEVVMEAAPVAAEMPFFNLQRSCIFFSASFTFSSDPGSPAS